MPTISIIIPAYNRAELLRETLSSVTTQSFMDWECIVVDDGSTMDLSFAKTLDSRIRVVRQQNSGISIARNVGIAASQGEFIAFLDSDDIWLPEKLELQIAAMAGAESPSLCYTSVGGIDLAGTRATMSQDRKARLTYESMLRHGCPNASTIMVKRSCLQEVGVFDPLMPFAEDHDLILRIVRRYPITYVPEPVVLIRSHNGPESYSKDYAAGVPFLRLLAAKHAANARRKGDLSAVKAVGKWMPFWYGVLGAQAYDAARICVRRRDLASAIFHILRAFRWAPAYTASASLRYLVAKIGRRPKEVKPSSETRD